MIKIIILSCVVCWMFIRQLTKSKPNSIWRIKLRRLSRYALLGAIVWLIIIALGPAKYQVFTDKIYTYRGTIKTVFAWEENRLLPIPSLATPRLLSLDYQTSYPMSEKTTQSLMNYYPYQKGSIDKYLGSVLAFLLLLSYLSRHITTDRRWQEALATDSKSGYRDFRTWSDSNLFRRLHCIGLKKEADIAMQSIDQRGRLKLEIYRRAYQEKKLRATFLEMLDEIVKSGHHNITVKASLYHKKEMTAEDSVDDFIQQESAQNPKLFMHKYYQLLKHRATQKENPRKFDTYVLNSPEHLRFTYPEPEVAHQLLEQQLVSVLNQGKKRFIGDDIVEFYPRSSNEHPDSSVSLEMDYVCLLDYEDESRDASIWGGQLNYKTITMDGVEYPGGSPLWFVFGLMFNWRLVIDGKEVMSGDAYTFPDATLCNESRPKKKDLPAKSVIEKQIFEVVALSNVSSFFSQLMGIDRDAMHKHTIELNAHTAGEAKRQTQKANELSEKLEEALRGESLEELLKSSGEELYKHNKEAVDAVISDYIQNYGDTDTILMIIDVLGDAAPELANYLVEIIGGLDE